MARGFTLVEMVVTLVVVGVVALIAIPTYQHHVVTVNDKGARNVLLQVAEDTQGLLESEQLDAFSFPVVSRAVAGLPASRALAPAPGTTAAAGFTLLADGAPSTTWGEVSVSIARGATASELGIATMSRSGHCAKASVPTSGSPTVTLDESPAAGSCTGSSAFPAPPDAVVASCTPHDRQLDVSWTPAPTGTPAAEYRVYRDGAEVTHVAAGTTSTSLRDLVNGQRYDIVVRGVDEWGQLGPTSTGASCMGATPTDDAAPLPPSAVTATGGQRQATVTWTPPADTDLRAYRVYRAGQLVGTVPSGTLRWVDQGSTGTGLDPGTPPEWRSYTYTVKAVDTSGNLSAASDAASATVTDGTAPDTPTPQVTPGVGQITVSWDPITVATGDLGGYRVYRCTGASCVDATLVQTLAGSGTVSWVDTGRASGTYYKYWVSAYDASGNESAQGGPVGTTTAVVPEPPTVSAAPTETAIAWSWNRPDGTVAFETAGADAHLGATPAAADGSDYPVTTTTVTSSGLTAAASYSLQLRACSAAGCSAWTTTTAYTLTAAPPTVAATTTQVRQATVTWTAPAGTVTGYAVYRSAGTTAATATRITAITTPGTLSYVDTGLENGATYSYWVRAVNASGEGSWSSRAQGGTLAPPAWATFYGSHCPVGYDADVSPAEWRSVDHPTSCSLVLIDDGTATSRTIQVNGPEGYTRSFTTNVVTADDLPYAADEDLRLELSGSACNEAGCTDAQLAVNTAPRPEAPTVTRTGCGFGVCIYTIAGRSATTYEVNVYTTLASTYVNCPDTGVYCSGGPFGAATQGPVTYTGAGLYSFHITTRCPAGTATASGCTRTVYLPDDPGVALRAAGTSNVWWLPGGWCQPAGVNLAPTTASCQFSPYVSSGSGTKPTSVSFASTHCPSYFDGTVAAAEWRSVDHPDECTYAMDALDATSYSFSVTNAGTSMAATYTDSFTSTPVSSKANGKTLPYAAELYTATNYHLTLTGEACNAYGCTAAPSTTVYALPRPDVPVITKGSCTSGRCQYRITGTGATHYELKLAVLAGSVTVDCAVSGSYCQGDSYPKSTPQYYAWDDTTYLNPAATVTFGPGVWRFRLTMGCKYASGAAPTGCTRTVKVSAGGLLYAAGGAEMWPARDATGNTAWVRPPGVAYHATKNPYAGSGLGWCLRTAYDTPPAGSYVGAGSGSGWTSPDPSTPTTDSCRFSDFTVTEGS